MTIKEIISGHLGISSNKPFDRLHNGPSGGAYSFPGPMYPPYPPPQSTYHAPPIYHGPPAPPVYHAPSASPPAIFKHYSFNHSGGGKGGSGGSAALSALTLLSFLFFLNILQQCLKDQMTTMNPSVIVMSSGREETLRSEKTNIKEPEKVYTLIDSASRKFPENVEHSEEKHASKGKILKVDARGRPVEIETVFISAMTDGTGEIIEEN